MIRKLKPAANGRTSAATRLAAFEALRLKQEPAQRALTLAVPPHARDAVGAFLLNLTGIGFADDGAAAAVLPLFCPLLDDMAEDTATSRVAALRLAWVALGGGEIAKLPVAEGRHACHVVAMRLPCDFHVIAM